MQILGEKGAGIRAAMLSACVPALIIIAWELGVRSGGLPKSLIAAPSLVVTRAVEMIGDGSLFKHCLVSIERLGIGFVIGVTLGVSLGVLVGTSKTASRLLEPTILTLIPVPPIAWIPLLIILLGIGNSSKIALIAIGSFCTLFINAAYSVRTTDSSLVELGQVVGKSRTEIAWSILIPASVPNILSAARIAMALSWTLLICAEVVASSSGLGWLIWDARNFSRPDDMIVGMATVAILGKSTDFALQTAERAMTRWKMSYRDLKDV